MKDYEVALKVLETVSTHKTLQSAFLKTKAGRQMEGVDFSQSLSPAKNLILKEHARCL